VLDYSLAMFEFFYISFIVPPVYYRL